jgi:hypothetical protein
MSLTGIDPAQQLENRFQSACSHLADSLEDTSVLGSYLVMREKMEEILDSELMRNTRLSLSGYYHKIW